MHVIKSHLFLIVHHLESPLVLLHQEETEERFHYLQMLWQHRSCRNQATNTDLRVLLPSY